MNSTVNKEDNYTCDSCKHLGAVVKFCGNISKVEFYMCGYQDDLDVKLMAKVKPTDICHIDKYEYSNLDFPND